MSTITDSGLITREELQAIFVAGAKPGEDVWFRAFASLVFKNDDLRALFLQIATAAEAAAGLDNTKIMTALRVKSVVTAAIATIEKASSEDAVAGTDDGKMMTAVTVKDAIYAALIALKGADLPAAADTLKKLYDLLEAKRNLNDKIFNHTGNWDADFGLLTKNTANTDASFRFETSGKIGKIALTNTGRLHFRDGVAGDGNTNIALDQLATKEHVNQRIERRVRMNGAISGAVYVVIGSGRWGYGGGTSAFKHSEAYFVSGLEVEDTIGEVASIKVCFSRVRIKED